MKNKILKMFALIFCAAIFLTGCATVSNVKINGKNAYFEEIQYYQGQVVRVGDYLYYGNGYTSSSDDNFSYGNAKNTGYLARLDISKPFTFGDKVEEEQKPMSSPNGIEKVNGDKLIGYQQQNMFALGDYIYFSSPNTHKTSQLENDYTRVSLFRVKFNGDNCSELVKNSAFKQGTGSTITVQKGSDNNYYYIIVEPTDNNTFSIKSLRIGGSIGKLKTLAEEVTSYAIADNSSSVRNIVYAVASEQAQTTTAVKAVDFASGEVTELDNGVTGSSINFLGRVADNIFYAYKNATNKVEEIYYKSISNGQSNFSPTQKFYSATTISDIRAAGNGVVFKTSGNALMYKELGSNKESELLLTKDDFTDILFVDEDYIYTSTTTTIKRISTINKAVETILSLEGNELISGQCGYDREYIYYYSKIVLPKIDGQEEEQEADERYYMFRTDMHGNTQLIGKNA